MAIAILGKPKGGCNPPAASKPRNKLNLVPIPHAENITAREFRTLYMDPLRPVIIRDLASSWPALRKWTPGYFKERYGQLQVKVYDASYARPGKNYMTSVNRIPFKKYLDLMTTSSIDLRMFAFNISWNAPELKQDINFPPITNGFSKKLILMFFGCKNSVTPMHYDLDMKHVLHTVLYGKKRVVLFPYEESKNLYQHPFNTRSYVDVDDPDFDKFPRLRNVKGYQDIVHPGETLFIPSGYWHYMVYEEGGYAVTIRRPNSSLAKRLRGYINIVVFFPIDKAMNRLLSNRWYAFKERRGVSQ